jgi:hydrogenase-4 component F
MLFGLISFVVAALFILIQRDYKRMFAYSSVEHMGILSLGLGIGGPALFGTLLHMITNGMTKGVLFLSAGNIHRAYASKRSDQVRGAIRRLPVSGMLFLFGFLAITGSPPFGPFRSEYAILSGALGAGLFTVAALFLVLLLAVFIGMGASVLPIVQGRPPAEVRHSPYRDGWLTAAPVVLFMALVVLLGLQLPGPLAAMINDAVRYLEVRA